MADEKKKYNKKFTIEDMDDIIEDLKVRNPEEMFIGFATEEGRDAFAVEVDKKLKEWANGIVSEKPVKVNTLSFLEAMKECRNGKTVSMVGEGSINAEFYQDKIDVLTTYVLNDGFDQINPFYPKLTIQRYFHDKWVIIDEPVNKGESPNDSTHSVPYQACPRCSVHGTVPIDIICEVCKGEKIIPQYIIPEG